MKRKLVFLIFLPMFSLQFCGSLKNSISSDVQYEILEPLQIKLGYELTGLRVDVVRQIDSCGQNCSRPRPYSPIGIDLGNALFLDAGMNLSVDLLKYSQLKNKNFSLRGKSSNGYSFDAALHNQLLKVQTNGVFQSPLTAHINGSSIKIDGGFLKSEQDIQFKTNTVDWDPHGVFANLQRIVIRIDGSKVLVSNGDGTLLYEILTTNSEVKVLSKYFLAMNREMIKIVYEQNQNEIQIVSQSLFTPIIRKFKTTSDSIYCYDQNYHGFIIQNHNEEKKLEIIQKMPLNNYSLNLEYAL